MCTVNDSSLGYPWPYCAVYVVTRRCGKDEDKLCRLWAHEKSIVSVMKYGKFHSRCE